MRKTKLLAFSMFLALGACKGGSLSKDECTKLIDHMTDVAVKGQGLSGDMAKTATDMAKAQMGSMVDECVKEGTRSDYDCAMAANTVDEMEKCTK
jgi:predicted GNAT family acetyltransferase